MQPKHTPPHQVILVQDRTDEERKRRHLYGDSGATFSKSKYLQPSANRYSNTITTVLKDNLIMTQENETTNKGLPLIYDKDGKPYTPAIRKLTPRECFRLMDVDDNIIDTIQAAGISKTQQYKMAGNSIVVNVLFHIFRKMFVETETESSQLSLFD